MKEILHVTCNTKEFENLLHNTVLPFLDNEKNRTVFCVLDSLKTTGVNTNERVVAEILLNEMKSWDPIRVQRKILSNYAFKSSDSDGKIGDEVLYDRNQYNVKYQFTVVFESYDSEWIYWFVFHQLSLKMWKDGKEIDGELLFAHILILRM